MDKCKDQPKLFYKFINGKLKSRHEIQRVKVKGETFDNMSDIVERMNECIQTVFTRENELEDLNLEKNIRELKELGWREYKRHQEKSENY